MRCRAAAHSPDARTVLGRVRGKASSARSLALSVSVRVNEDNALLDTGHADFLNAAVTMLLASTYKVGAY